MRLRDFFSAVAIKRLSSVEANSSRSNQHEFNGINRFREMLGNEKRSFPTAFLYLNDDIEPIHARGETTWYDARLQNPDRAAEYRLYFPASEVSQRFSEGDLIIVARRPDDSLLIIATPQYSSVGDQLIWLFGLQPPTGSYEVRDGAEIDRDVDYVVRLVLESIGVESPVPETDAELLRRRFGAAMPTTREFSAFARTQAIACDPLDDPDQSLMRWLEMEERLFRTFERLLIEQRLRSGFVEHDGHVDVDGFVGFSLGVQNRRKSRAGYALENHLEHIFVTNGIAFARGATTEGRSKPDFVFPGRDQYQNGSFPQQKLSILGAKASCKDRWRQILGEADRVSPKHLMTLEPSISTHQTDEMQTRQVQLVLPEQVHSSYSLAQRRWLWTLKTFVDHVRRLET